MLDGCTKDEVVEKIQEFFFSLENKNDMRDAKGFSEHCVPYCETALSGSEEEIICEILSGQLALLVEGFDRCILIDTRTYPQRPTSEPEKDKSFRGSHDGFVETIVFQNRYCSLLSVRQSRSDSAERRTGSPHSAQPCCPDHERAKPGGSAFPFSMVQPLSQGSVHGAAGHSRSTNL